jgi:tetratricopeptide (TPR) repeat protein
LILLLPSSSIFPAEDLAADRRVYLPMLAFAGFAGILLSQVNRRMILISVTAGLAGLSVMRAQLWTDDRALWTEAVERAPKKLRPKLMLARMSDLGDALLLLDAAREIAPLDPKPRLEKGLRLMQAGKADLALIEFEHALSLAPEDVAALNNHAAALAALGNRAAAIEEFRRVLRLDPCWASARSNLMQMGVTHNGACQAP